MEIKDFKTYSKNPRGITDEQIENLEEWLLELGDLSGIVVNTRNNEVVGGNQRTSIFKNNNAKVVIDEKFKADEQGTVGRGWVILDEKKYSLRLVDWDQKTADKANIVANKAGGYWDFDILATEFEADDLVDWGFNPAEVTISESNILDKDDSDLESSRDSYVNGTIKQIVLYFDNEQYTKTLDKMADLMAKTGTDSHTDLFLKMLQEYEIHHS